MQVSLLGPVGVRADDGTPIDIGGARLRMLLARLALDAPRAVAADTLIDGLWGALPPADAANALQSPVSRLRKALGDSTRLASGTAGYVLAVESVDASRFEELAARGRRELAAGGYAEAAVVLGEALGLWQGEPLSDVLDAPFAQAPATRLAELRLAAIEDRFEAELELGRHAEVLADLETAGAAHPLRERLAGLRMRALYAAGRQSDALAVFERTRAILAEELGVDPSAELREVHLAVLRGEIATTRPETDHLPVRLTSFVGRGKELDLLARSLTDARLVTLVGPGGAGKTRLATEAAVRHPVHRRGRVWFVALASVRDPGDLTSAVLGALGSLDMRLLNTAPSMQPADPLERVRELIGSGEALLVLDNCEHLVGAAAELTHELLGRVPGLRVLATSREPLAITGEVLCHLGPLEEAEAMRLFVERAETVRPGFVLDELTREPVAEICRRLDGLPLALELAAARLRSMTPEQIAKRLDDRFRLLTSGSRVALPRQRTLRAVVEWSWDLLEKPERVLARRLSVFPGGVTVSAAEAVCADDLLPEQDVLYVLGSLVEKSIVDSVDAVEPRYRMLETIRAYGEERLDEAAERAVVARRFAEYYVGFAESHEAALRTAAQLGAIAAFEAEYDNMTRGLRWAIDNDEAGIAHRYVTALMWYWVIRGFDDQPKQHITDVLDFGDRIPGDVRATLAALKTLMEALPHVGSSPDLAVIIDDCVRTGALRRFPALGLAVPMLAFLARERALADRELARAATHPDPWVRACARWAEAFFLDDDGDLDGSERARGAALAGFEQVGDRWGIAMTLAMQAGSHSLRGDHERAIVGYQRGLAMARELNSVDDTVQQLSSLASERLRSGDPEGAWRDLEEAERIADAAGQDEYSAIVRFSIVDVARRAGDLPRAREALEWIRIHSPGLPFPPGMADEWLAMFEAAMAVAEGDATRARQRLPEALRTSSERQDMPDVARAAQVAAALFALEGNEELAAWTLGATKAIRGAFDEGDPELAELATKLSAVLGADGYRNAYERGAGLAKPDAIAQLLARFS
ncbi:AfsR/SARP family transcriptional regulator [Amycolatopsis sp. K13G38]|uniref:AfsR/SARP family transcriptional regulator n=1 Tax=Amycolatopsis acididurans TaxID=2724524 RepID=A0ABX1JBA4_9PSEU|nr:BTAD domain-containing putative transcriptional regulator [Amycolatopsis acididurans]NKQ57075.1 AfsR/SARP family transcriptional regulator [Amycolatopsis acididurans]